MILYNFCQVLFYRNIPLMSCCMFQINLEPGSIFSLTWTICQSNNVPCFIRDVKHFSIISWWVYSIKTSMESRKWTPKPDPQERISMSFYGRVESRKGLNRYKSKKISLLMLMKGNYFKVHHLEKKCKNIIFYPSWAKREREFSKNH